MAGNCPLRVARRFQLLSPSRWCTAATFSLSGLSEVFMLDIWVLVLLGVVGVVAGFVDAVAGGGGLIAVPALLSAGLSPVAALATNKAQSVVGTITAAWTFWRQGYVAIKTLIPGIAATFVGSFIGALVVKSIDTSALNIAVPVAVIAVAAYFSLSPSIKDVDRA